MSPDNWLISPQLILGGVLSLWACGQDSDFFTENFAVYVCIDGLTDGEGSIQVGDYHFLQVGTDITATKEMTEYEFGLSQFQGQTGRFAIRHYNSADKYMLNIDDVKLDLMMQTYPTLPEDLTVTPSSTTAHVTWTDTDDEVWNLRYRIFTPSLKESYSWDFESEESRAEWTSIDKDGDGNNWFPSDAHGNPHGGQYSMESDSYDYPSSRELNPDNWLISPKVTLGGTLSLWANSWHGNYPDNFAVYVLTGTYDNANFNPNAWVKVGEDHQPTNWQKYTYDLTSFAEQEGHFAIRHYNSYDNWGLLIDDIALEIPGDAPAEWAVADGLTTTSHTLENLTPETTYEVQVQASNERAGSQWTESVVFTTTAGPIDITLYDAADNGETISDNDGQLVNVTISGRKFYKGGLWNSLCLPFDFTIEGSPLEDATIMVLDGSASSFDAATGSLTLSFTDYSEPVFAAGTTCLVRWNDASPSEVENLVFSGAVIKDVAPLATTSSDGAVTFAGHYSPITTGPDNTLLYLGSGNTLYWPDDQMTFGALRATFRLNDGLACGEPGFSGQVSLFVLQFSDGSETGIPLTHYQSPLTTDVWYTIDGRKLSGKPAVKGVYINNGRKAVIK